MAQGDAVYLPAATGYTGTVNFQPSSGVEYCITSAVGGSYSYMQWMNSAGNFDTNTLANRISPFDGKLAVSDWDDIDVINQKDNVDIVIEDSGIEGGVARDTDALSLLDNFFPSLPCIKGICAYFGISHSMALYIRFCLNTLLRWSSPLIIKLIPISKSSTTTDNIYVGVPSFLNRIKLSISLLFTEISPCIISLNLFTPSVGTFILTV